MELKRLVDKITMFIVLALVQYSKLLILLIDIL